MARWVLAVIVVLIPLLSLGSGPDESRQVRAEAENVVLIVVDTLAAQHLGFMGYERDTSPFMDRLASRSVVFTRAYTPKATTLPSFTSLLTGCHPDRHGVLNNGAILPEEIHFLTDDFRSAGFEAWGMPAARVLSAQYGIGRGFDYYANTPAIPHTAREMNERLSGILTGSPRFREPSLQDARKPLFLMIHFYDPHTEYTPDDEALEMFADPGYDGPVEGTWAQFKKYNQHEIEFNAGDLRRVCDLYDAEIRSFDARLRELFELLDRVGLLDTSVVVLTADHGENLGEHHFITHGQPYEQSLHIPLLVHFPNDKWGGRRIDALVENTDIVPTLMDFAGLRIPGNIDGRSLMPLVDPESDSPYSPRDYLYAIGNPTSSGYMYSLFDGKFRLTAEFDSFGGVNPDGGVMIFDIPNDPRETSSLANDPPEALKRLAPVLARMIVASHDGDAPLMTEQNREMLSSLGYL